MFVAVSALMAARLDFLWCLFEQSVFVLLGAGWIFLFTADQSQILGLKDDKQVKLSERYDSRITYWTRDDIIVRVYMSAITPRFVKNAFVPLLRTVPIKRTTFVHKHVEFARIQYLPVAYTDSEVAEVHECSDRGNAVCNNGGKMIANFYCNKYTGK